MENKSERFKIARIFFDNPNIDNVDKFISIGIQRTP